MVETVECAAPRAGDVLVRMEATSICHTDLEVLDGTMPFPLPMILGHEGAGIVEAVGAGVTTPVVGERVVLSWNPHCGECYFCAQDQPILCSQFVANLPAGFHFDGEPRIFSGGKPLHTLMYIGTFGQYCVVRSQMAVPVPMELPPDRACLLGCAVMTGFGATTNVAPVTPGSSVMVIGCGAIGLSAIQGARVAGAARILAVDLDDQKLARARQLGASDTCRIGAGDPLIAAHSISHGRGADYVFECAGHPDAFRLAVAGARAGGNVVWLGKVAASTEVSFPWGSLMGERRLVRSSYGGARPHRDFPRLAEAYLTGALLLDELVTARVTLDEINTGFDALRDGDAVRTVIMLD